MISIIIPTHNRIKMLLKVLDAFENQEAIEQTYEIIVVADSCSDDTVNVIEANKLKFSYDIKLVEHNYGSAAVSRNLGAKQAIGDLLVFIDDDVVPERNFLSAHLQNQNENTVVLGYSKPVLPKTPSLWQYRARRWWEDRFFEMNQPGHRFNFKDFFSGNFSISASQFNLIGGFDESLKRLEDYEFGLRLIKNGIHFAFSTEAVGLHYETNDLRQWLDRLRHDGEANYKMATVHPELKTTLFSETLNLPGVYKTIQNQTKSLAFRKNYFADKIESILYQFVLILEKMRLRGIWEKIVGALMEYNFWRGVANEVSSKNEFSNLMNEVNSQILISDDLPQIEFTDLFADSFQNDISEEANSKGLQITYYGKTICSFAPTPGSESLQNHHIVPMLYSKLKNIFSPELAISMINEKRMLVN
ncbi:MAG: glycosyltransferase [Ignavibacteriales bacterium]|nr:glycosyltransferase [Ignavibacteriales bacterium]